MSTDYSGDVRHKARETVANPDGIAEWGRFAADALERLDDELRGLLGQRLVLKRLIDSFRELYQDVTENRDLFDAVPELVRIEYPPKDSEADLWRRTVLQIARDCKESDGSAVELSVILDELERRLGKMPSWSNPAAAVSTILTRSGQWERIDRGLYEPKEGTPAVVT